MKPGYLPIVAQMQQSMSKAGYTPIEKQVEMVVTGKLALQTAGPVIELDGMQSPAVLSLEAPANEPARLQELRALAGRQVQVDGLWQAPPPGRPGAGSLVVKKIQAL